MLNLCCEVNGRLSAARAPSDDHSAYPVESLRRDLSSACFSVNALFELKLVLRKQFREHATKQN